MTSPIPVLITLPVLTGIALVLAGRWWLLRDSIVDRLINRALAACLFENLLRETWFQQSLAWLNVMTGQPSLDPEMHWKAWSSFLLSAVAAPAVVAVPLVSTLLTHIGWDRTGRYCRRLRPMWTDLTAAVPEIVLEPRRDQNRRTDPAIRLHRMTVEIRDSLLHLKRYSDSPDDLAATGGDPHIYARRIAEAIATKATGHPPSTSRFTPRYQVQPGARDLTAELRQLLALAKAWPHARGLTTTTGHSPQPTRPLTGCANRADFPPDRSPHSGDSAVRQRC
ncbi:MAB_1171c family putative transporter [Nocardia xishanensis]|uniref:MAB_1171c family putative transporter n=1 Tax=Nocardia xishanensis TaxID=238964 RepID=UPI0034118070